MVYLYLYMGYDKFVHFTAFITSYELEYVDNYFNNSLRTTRLFHIVYAHTMNPTPGAFTTYTLITV